MALAEYGPLAPRAPSSAVPPDVEQALVRGRREMSRDSAKRTLCARFERGEQFSYVDSKGFVANLATTLDAAGGKPRHRIRNSYNFIRPLVEDKVSASTSRIPSYEVVASTSDPDDKSAADTAQKVALYGYDRWRLRRVRMKVIKSAIAQGGDGFAFPYFEQNVGPYTLVDGEWVGQGEIRILTFGGNEVFWEPGVDFDDSSWYAIESARPIEKVRLTPGYCGGVLTSDATTADGPIKDKVRKSDGALVMVTDYLERPCPKWPMGRRIQMAGGKVIVDWRLVDPTTVNPWEPYPLRDHEGNILDEPCIHRLSYAVDPEADRDLGLVWQLIDAQRTINDCFNKLLEWKNRCLNPQLRAAVGSLVADPNDEPGFINYYHLGMPPPDWQPTPQIPQELFQIYNTMKEAMQFFASYADVSADPRVAAATVGAVQQQSHARWESFLGDLAEFDSRLMRHCLQLVANFYTEPRLLKINGWFGPDLISDFRGSQLNGQVDVTVLPGSLQQLSRGEMQQRLQWIATTFPGWLSPEQALAALDGGAAQTLVRGYELDDAKVCRIIQKIRDGSVMSMSTRQESDPQTGAPLMVPAPPDPATGQPPVDGAGQPVMVVAQVPAYMPMRDVDNLTVWRRRVGDWMKTPDYERTDPGLQEVAKQILAQINVLEQDAAMRQAAQQQQMAQSLGMGNAATPAQPKPMPSQPAPTGS